MTNHKFSDVEPYFLEKVDKLKKLLNSGYRFEATILALCYIDALGNLFMKGTGTKRKFINLILKYGVVDNFKWDKVNLAEFKKVEGKEKLKSKICSICYGRITQYIDQNICQYEYSDSNLCIKKDKCISGVINDLSIFGRDKSCKCNIISKVLLKCLYDSTYVAILYNKYRCEGVHKGKFDEWWDSLSGHFDGPFYMSIEDSLPDFSISPEFIIRTLEQCLVGLKSLSLTGPHSP